MVIPGTGSARWLTIGERKSKVNRVGVKKKREIKKK